MSEKKKKGKHVSTGKINWYFLLDDVIKKFEELEKSKKLLDAIEFADKQNQEYWNYHGNWWIWLGGSTVEDVVLIMDWYNDQKGRINNEIYYRLT